VIVIICDCQRHSVIYSDIARVICLRIIIICQKAAYRVGARDNNYIVGLILLIVQRSVQASQLRSRWAARAVRKPNAEMLVIIREFHDV